MRHFLKPSAVVLALLMAAPDAGLAQSRETLGVARFFNNDAIGDGRDRWRTGSFAYNQLRAATGTDTTQLGFGQVIEYRARTEIIAPLSNSAAPGDRLYVGAITLGMHSHFGDDRTQYSLGVDLVATGPQNGLSDFQARFHDRFDLIPTSYTDLQLGNTFNLGATAEAARSYAVSENLTVRPFLQTQLGIETLARVGADLVIGAGWQSDVMLRDVVTGQIYPGIDQPQPTGLTFILGADAAYVADSIYLPDSRGYAIEDNRIRLRAGATWQITETASVYYGLTYLSPEEKAQSEGQTTGSLQINFSF